MKIYNFSTSQNIKLEGRKIKFFNLMLKYVDLNIYPLKIFIKKGSVIKSRTIIKSGTRINGRISIKGGGGLEIGKYCALGEDIHIITSNHDINVLNIQYALQLEINNTIFSNSKKNVYIGNNVWIGDSVIILPGVNIGDCAVIGAGSVVTRDIPSFAVAAGNPARVLRYRFAQEIVDILSALKWWEWPLSKMRANKWLFELNLSSTNPDELLCKLQEASLI